MPRRWLKKVRRSLASLGPQVTASRMVADYVEELYEPTGARATALTADGHARARALAAWKARVREAWHGVHVDRVDGDMAAADVGGSRTIEAVVALGDLGADDVDVQLVHGPVGQADEMTETTVLSMTAAGPANSRTMAWAASRSSRLLYDSSLPWSFRAVASVPGCAGAWT